MRQVDPLGHFTQTRHNGHDRLVEVRQGTDPATHYTYGVRGNPALISIPEGGVTTTVYHGYDRPVLVTQPQGLEL